MSDEPGSNVHKLPGRRARERAQPAPGPEATAAGRRQKITQILGPGCPYEPIGYDGKSYWILGGSGHLQGRTARELGRNEMVSLCGSDVWLKERYPRSRKGKPVSGFASEEASSQLMRACHVLGHWERATHERGLGAWLGADGDLILHRGNSLMINGVIRPLGRYGDHLYTLRPALAPLPPSTDPAVARAAWDLLARLDTFAWRRGTLDSTLCLGWLGSSILAGALAWRAHLWVAAELQSGKSTLLDRCIAETLRGAIVSVTDITAAGIRRALNYASIPVAYDEFEATGEAYERQQAVLKVIRDSSSGGNAVRAGQGAEAVAFPVQSAFCCSSIIVPPMLAQDRSRFLFLELLQEVPAGDFSQDRLVAIGAALTRRLIDRWVVLTKEVIPAFRETLGKLTSRRLVDLYATVFGCAAVALYDDVSQFRLERYLDTPHMHEVFADAIDDQAPEWRRLVEHFMSTPSNRIRIELPLWGEFVETGSAKLRRPDGQRVFDLQGRDFGPDPVDDAQRRLASIGVKIEGAYPDPVIVFATSHRGLAAIFAETQWRTQPGAPGSSSGWAQVLRRAPGAKLMRQVRFGQGVRLPAVAVPLSLLLGPIDRPPANEHEAAAAESRESFH